MKKILIKNVRLLSKDDDLNYDKKDLYIENGYIKEIAEKLEKVDAYLIDGENKILSPGFIDIHVHAYEVGEYGLSIDEAGAEVKTTTIIDAGTSGPNNIDDFKKYIKKAKTRCFVLMNCSNDGLLKKHELDDLTKLNLENCQNAYKRNKDIIVGIKARASRSVVGEMGIEPIKKAKMISDNLNLPLTVHIGNNPPELLDVLKVVGNGDVITHTYHGKKEKGIIRDNKLIKEAILARENGVVFDIGHGIESFNFNTYKRACELEFKEDLISSDLHKKNIDHVVYSLVKVMDKILNLGNDLATVVAEVTSRPAKVYNLEKLGRLKVGYYADLCLFDLQECHEKVFDSDLNELLLKKKIAVSKIIISKGRDSEIY